MTRLKASVHIRIGRLTVHEAALGRQGEADFVAQLSEAIAGRISGDAVVPPVLLADRIVDAISARRARPTAPTRSSGGSGGSR